MSLPCPRTGRWLCETDNHFAQSKLWRSLVELCQEYPPKTDSNNEFNMFWQKLCLILNEYRISEL